MSRINELINELCPCGVEYKKLSDLLQVNRGRRLTKNQLIANGKYEVYHGSKDTPLGKFDKYNTPGDTVNVVNTGGIGGVKYLKDNFWCSDGSFSIGHSNSINNKFLFHYLSQYEDYFLSQKRIGGVPTIDRSVIENVKIPVVPLEIQVEISNILDMFCNIRDIIDAEIEGTKKELEFYKRKIFSQCKHTCKIGDIAEKHKEKNKNQLINNAYSITQRGLMPTKEYFGEKTKITSSDTSGYYIVEKGWFVYSPSRIDVGSISYLKENQTVIVSPIDVVFSVNNEKVDNDYLLNYLLSAKGMSQILFYRQGIEGTGRKNLPFENFSKIEIPIPNIDTQKKYVERINIFENYINGVLIPKKNLYKKQYEYYRNKLLSFEELSVSE